MKFIFTVSLVFRSIRGAPSIRYEKADYMIMDPYLPVQNVLTEVIYCENNPSISTCVDAIAQQI
ncbi:hypothetical protein DSO57_1003093 [Entomophthora muscae]|uniref:Uncharacterized protein n=1 Tax=Entomophthora muscae TaxID=34485 RepID=A0ACC2UI00_9FUNG|nr:hypothetical protein DSO57_1003093 [Entomophthora muscae]